MALYVPLSAIESEHACAEELAAQPGIAATTTSVALAIAPTARVGRSSHHVLPSIVRSCCIARLVGIQPRAAAPVLEVRYQYHSGSNLDISQHPSTFVSVTRTLLVVKTASGLSFGGGLMDKHKHHSRIRVQLRHCGALHAGGCLHALAPDGWCHEVATEIVEIA